MVALGAIGVFVPLLPTTPFLLLAAYLFFKSSDRLYNWLIRNKYFGNYIENYRKYKAITLRSKIFSLLLLWGSITYSSFCFVDEWWIRILLFVVAIGVSIHILRFKTLRKVVHNNEEENLKN